MPDDNDVKQLLAGATAPNTLDAKRIVARSRARRLPKQFAAGTLGALAIVGVAVLGVQTAQFGSTSGTATSLSESAPQSDAAGIKRAPADKINLCTGTLAEVAPSQYGLLLEVVPPETAPVGTAPVTVTVRLTNTSDREVTGATPTSPALTLSQNGIVLWHSNGVSNDALREVDLAPGASVDYTAQFVPVRCGVDDDLAESFRPDLPALEPGSYQLSALMDVSGDAMLDLVSGPAATFTLG